MSLSERYGLSMATPQRDDIYQFAELLLQDGLIQEESWQTAVAIQQSQGGRLLEILMGLCPITEEDMYLATARQLGLPFWNEHELTSLQLTSDLINIFPLNFVMEYTFIPIKLDLHEQALHLILPNPLDEFTLQAIKVQAGVSQLAIGISNPSALLAAIQVLYEQVGYSQPPADAGFPEEENTDIAQNPISSSGGFGIAPPKVEVKSCPACKYPAPIGQAHCPRCGSPLDLTQADPLLGKLVGRFKLIDKLGEGGMGLVYMAQSLDTGQNAAVKILRTHLTTNERVVRRFHREAKAQNQLRHPNIVYVHDFGFEEGIGFYLAMEFLKGDSLEEILEEKPELITSRFVYNVFRQVSDAMGFAHSRGIFHRDLKPDNIFLLEGPNSRPEERRVKILDFGVAKMVESEEDQRLTRTGMTIGTPLYMAPEQAGEGNTDHRSDIYSIGVILFEVLTGKPPFEGSSAYQIMLRHVYAEPPALAQTRGDLPFPMELEDLIQSSLAKTPQERPASMDLFWRQLSHAMELFRTRLDPNIPLISTAQAKQRRGSDSGSGANTPSGDAPVIVGRMLASSEMDQPKTPEPANDLMNDLLVDQSMPTQAGASYSGGNGNPLSRAPSADRHAPLSSAREPLSSAREPLSSARDPLSNAREPLHNDYSMEDYDDYQESSLSIEDNYNQRPNTPSSLGRIASGTGGHSNFDRTYSSHIRSSIQITPRAKTPLRPSSTRAQNSPTKPKPKPKPKPKQHPRRPQRNRYKPSALKRRSWVEYLPYVMAVLLFCGAVAAAAWYLYVAPK